MTGSGPAGELTFHDVRRRLGAVTDHVVAAEADHEATAASVAAAREPEVSEEGPATEA